MGEAGVAAKAAQALGVARMASQPQALEGAVAGRKSRGTASATAAAGGKVMRRERATEAFTGVVALHSRVALARLAGEVRGGGAGALQAPAVAARVPGVAQQLQAAQPVEN